MASTDNPKNELKPTIETFDPKFSLANFAYSEGILNDHFTNLDYIDGLNGLNKYNSEMAGLNAKDMALSSITSTDRQENGLAFTVVFNNVDGHQFEVNRTVPKPKPEHEPENDPKHEIKNTFDTENETHGLGLSLKLKLEPEQVSEMSDHEYKKSLDTINDVSMNDMLRYHINQMNHGSPYAPDGPLADASNAEQRLRMEQDSIYETYQRYEKDFDNADMQPKIFFRDEDILVNYQQWYRNQLSVDRQHHFDGGDVSPLSASPRMTPSFVNREHDHTFSFDEDPSKVGYNPQEDPNAELDKKRNSNPTASPTSIPSTRSRPTPFDDNQS